MVMTCDLCSKNEATVHLSEVINDQTRELHLCEQCAREKAAEAAGLFSTSGEQLLGGGLAELLGSLTDLGKLAAGTPGAALSCPQCGLTYEDFRKSGRLGCGKCYEAFHRVLAPLLKRIHGSTQHSGRTPPAQKAKPAQLQDELAQLKEQLKAAVAAESFEEAVRLRDRIRALEAKPRKTASFPRKRESG